MKVLARVLIALVALAAALGAAHAESLLVGPGGQPMRLQEALDRARDGDVIGLLPGTYNGEVAVIPARRLTLRGIGKRPVLVAGGRSAERKAIWVVRGGDVTIENIEFRGARVEAANGAGIRHEAGKLTVRRCEFRDNELGILSSNDPAAELVIDASVFADAPRVVGGLYHLLYIGRIASASITGSRFERGFEGHLIKSRARRTRIAYNLIRDGPEGGASYEIDLANGGLAWIVGNVIEQSPATQNQVVIAYGAEGGAWDRDALYVAHNTFVNDSLLPAWFLRVFRDRLRDETEVYAVNNLTVGLGVFTFGASGHFAGNYPVLEGMLVDPPTLAFELAPGSWLRGRGVDPRSVGGYDLAPRAEFTLPVGTRPLAPATSWTPGAFQR